MMLTPDRSRLAYCRPGREMGLSGPDQKNDADDCDDCAAEHFAITLQRPERQILQHDVREDAQCDISDDRADREASRHHGKQPRAETRCGEKRRYLFDRWGGAEDEKQ